MNLWQEFIVIRRLNIVYQPSFNSIKVIFVKQNSLNTLTKIFIMRITKNEFKIPPISTLIGSTIVNYFRILQQGRIAPKYYFKIFVSTICCFDCYTLSFLGKISF